MLPTYSPEMNPIKKKKFEKLFSNQVYIIHVLIMIYSKIKRIYELIKQHDTNNSKTTNNKMRNVYR